MKDLVRKHNELVAIGLSWSLIISLAIEELYRKYSYKLLSKSGFGWGPIPVDQGTALTVGILLLLIIAAYMIYIDYKIYKLGKEQ